MKNLTFEKLKRAELVVVGALMLFLALILAASSLTGFEEVIAEAKKIDMQLMSILLGLSLFNYTFRCSRWYLFAKKLNTPVPMHRIFLYYTAGFAVITTPGKVGTALRVWLMKKAHGYPMNRTISMMFMDLFTDFIAMAVLAVIGLQAFAGNYGVSFALFFAGLVGLTIMFYNPKFLFRMVKLAYVLVGKRMKKIFATIMKLLRHTRTLFSPTLLTTTSLISIVGWAAEVYAMWLLLAHLGADVSLTAVSFIFAFSTLVGGISMLPGGLGGVEATMFALLLAVGVPTETAITATAIIRLTTLWFAVGIGFVMMPLAFKIVGKNSDDK